MTLRTWQIEKIKYCEHAGREIALETEVVFPAEQLPEQAPRVLAHRCSNAAECNMLDKPVCAWCGTNPNYEPV
ncbi:MAG: hypothetical protein ACOY0R_06955 [Chloroflexota bacterium]